jgi:GT2 family glycosyltransferase
MTPDRLDAQGRTAINRNKLAVLMTCHNRRDVTLSCLKSLFAQEESATDVSVFLVDDGSTDGTSDAIASEFPEVQIVEGTGELYWSGGMQLAFEVASREEFDFHLWLNDDVYLHNDAIKWLLSAYDEVRQRGPWPTVVTGAVRDPVTGVTTFGGSRRRSSWHPLRFQIVEPGPDPKICDTISGNVVLIPRDVLDVLGGVDPVFVHGFGDEDYGLRLGGIGGRVWLAPLHVGTCSKNLAASYADSTFAGLQSLMSVKNLPPREYLIYTRRHGGLLWPLLWAGPYVRCLAMAMAQALLSLVRPRRGEG